MAPGERFVVDNTSELIRDLLNMAKGGTTNDVKIILEDGEIFANKAILIARSDYFATMLSNSNKNQFVEGRTNSVDLSFCSKVVMEKIINYLFSGRMNLHELSVPNMINILNMAKMMLMDSLCERIETILSEFIFLDTEYPRIIPELINGVVLAERYNLVNVKNELCKSIALSLKDIINAPEIFDESDHFRTLPIHIVKQILLQEKVNSFYDVFNSEDFKSVSMARLQGFMFWLSGNECRDDDEDKKEIVENIDLETFTIEELFSVVRKSGLFSVEMVDQRILHILKNCKCKILDTPFPPPALTDSDCTSDSEFELAPTAGNDYFESADSESDY